jgi:uncharacterized protein
MKLHSEISTSKILVVLIGFPIISTLISLLLLDKSSLSWTGMDFFSAFWLFITAWYAIQIYILSRVLKSSGWTWSDIGFSLNHRRTMFFVIGYLVFALALVGFTELALASASTDPEKMRALSDLSNLTPKKLPQRLIFVFMGLVAGLCEELVYRGFAINSLRSRGLNQWLACLAACIPFVFQHGLKSIEQFWWFFIWGSVFGTLFIFTKKLYINVIIHWLVILSGIVAVLQTLQ